MRGVLVRLTGMLVAAVLFASPAAAREVEVDISACRGMYEVLRAMRNGAPEATVSRKLDALLGTRPYEVMFSHYNRSWRPNHLPKDVFKRMILSLQFKGAYTSGENERADAMRARWKDYYPDLPTYERQLRQLERADLQKAIDRGVKYAQTWLPDGWTIPDFYFPIIPNGGSPAFTIGNSQGFDFLQLAHDGQGKINIEWLVGTISHESHHLGMHMTVPVPLSKKDEIALAVVTLCIPEGMATAFISGPPPGHAPVVPGVPFHLFTPDLVAAWNQRLPEEEEMVRRQALLLERASAGDLTQEAFNAELADYWLNGLIGRAYVLGTDMMSAIDLAFGKQAVFEVLRDPRQLFRTYNAALDKEPDRLRRCVRFPDTAVRQALALGALGSEGRTNE